MSEVQDGAAAQPVFNEHVALYLEIYREQVGRSDTWGLEALRNLVLLNAAGIAGTITAYQIQAIPRAITPAACYLAGIAGAFIAIALGWFLHRMLAKKYERNAAIYKETRNPLVLFDVDAKRFESLNRASIAVGILSLILFLIGSAFLVDLVRQPSAATASAKVLSSQGTQTDVTAENDSKAD